MFSAGPDGQTNEKHTSPIKIIEFPDKEPYNKKPYEGTRNQQDRRTNH